MTTVPNAPHVRIVRRFGVPPETVFDTLTKPHLMRAWWGDDTTFEIDLRVGGRWTVTRRDGDDTYVATGEYQVVEPPSRLAYTYAMPQFSPNTDRISIEIAPEGSGSIMTFIHAGDDIASELRDVPPGGVSASEAGWQQGFDLMASSWA